MGWKVSLEAAVNFTKKSVYLAHSWPPSQVLTKWDRIKLDTVWFLSLLSALGLLVPLLISVYQHQSSSFVLTQSVCFVGAICNFIVKMIVYRIDRDRTQILTKDLESFLTTAEPREKNVLQRYVDRSSMFHAVITFWNFMAAAIMMCGPLVLPQQFPTDATYPFPLDNLLIKFFIYLHQCFVGFQCSTGATIDCQTALMMWFAGARLELLADELKNVSDCKELRQFVQKHQRLLWYADEVSRTMRYIAFTTFIMGGLGTVFSALQILSNQPIVVKLLFGPIALIASMNLFVCSWAADNMIQVCQNVATHNASWIYFTPEMMKNYLMILRRSQRPVTVSLGGFLPTLSLHSYAMYLSTAFSYTTTLRVVMNSDSKT